MPARRLVLLLLLALLVQPRLLAAQEPSIRGVVSDRQGGVVVGADVTLISEAGAIRYGHDSDRWCIYVRRRPARTVHPCR